MTIKGDNFEQSLFGLYLSANAYNEVVHRKRHFCLDKVRVREAIEKDINKITYDIILQVKKEHPIAKPDFITQRCMYLFGEKIKHKLDIEEK